MLGLGSTLWVSFNAISHFIKPPVQQIYWTPIIYQALCGGIKKTDKQVPAYGPLMLCGDIKKTGKQVPAYMVFATQWGEIGKQQSSYIITNSHKHYEIQGAIRMYNRKNWFILRSRWQRLPWRSDSWAKIWKVGANQDKKQGKGVVDRGNSKCKILEAKELLVPGWAKRKPEWLASREVGQDLILQVL